MKFLSSQFLEFQLKPTAAAESGVLGPLAIQGSKKENVFAVQTLGYTHIPKQYIAQPSEARAVRLDLKIPKINVGYIAGAGDTVKERLQTVGLSVESIDIETTSNRSCPASSFPVKLANKFIKLMKKSHKNA